MEVSTIATVEDREYAWRHAFAYADRFASTDDAADYAHYYAGLIADEDSMAYWPAHGTTFAAWRARR
jgi:hypothetical protein